MNRLLLILLLLCPMFCLAQQDTIHNSPSGAQSTIPQDSLAQQDTIHNSPSGAQSTIPQDSLAQPAPISSPIGGGREGAPDSSAVYEGLSLKLDLFTPILELARSKAKVQSYEIGISCRLKQRFYPTLELGYARAQIDADGAHHFGQGGFFRAGLDLNGLKKNTERLNALLVGIRIGTAIQQYQLTDITVSSPFWFGNEPYRFDLDKKVGTDCWGEVVFGCQVQVYKGFQMGWNLRLKLLMTRKAKDGGGLPAYIPGYGFRDDTNWGINYTIGYYFK